MSPKELLYIEDALGHTSHMKTCCRSVTGELADAELKTFAEQLAARHQQAFDRFYQLLK